MKKYKKVHISKFELNWQERFYELKAFKDRYGHCNVPNRYPENPGLGHWVIRQRVYKRKLSDDRIDQLDSIGFIWNMYDYRWECKFNELQAFKKRFGHCDVSKGMPGYVMLADWCIKQRQDFKNKRTRLKADQIERLKAIGFDWEKITRVPWEHRYKELEVFKKKYGHCRVPRRYKENISLANWVSIQRRDREKLSKRKIDLLNTIGFVWQIKKRRKT